MNTSKQVNVMVLLVFLAVFITAGYTLWDPTRAEDAQDEQLEGTVRRGAYLFSANCRFCHGDAGEGGSASNRLRAAPALNRDGLQGTIDGVRDPIKYANDYKFVYYTITCGRVGKLMPAWAQTQGGTLNAEQIKQLTTFIVNGAGLHPAPSATPAEGDESAAEEEPEELAWDLAREFGQRGVEEFHIEGDDHLDLALAEAVAESDTTLVLNHVTVAGAQVVFPNERLSIIDEDGEAIEIFLVTDVGTETLPDGTEIAANPVTVERGVGTTDAGAHAAGIEVLKPPVPPAGEILEQSCGQIAGSQVVVPPEAPSAALSITAEGIAWNKTALSAIAGDDLSITVQNNDDATAHNWHLTEGADPGGDEVATTEIENGVITQTLDFGPLAAGEYYYVCDVHTNMEGVLTAYAPGEGPEGAPTPAP
jgi:mono/diheme cytochrome c family protein/plastocyanin